MRHLLFKPRIFTALIKNRNFRPLSLVPASMHSYLFYKKRMFSFCPFSFVFFNEFNKYCRLLCVCGLSTRNFYFVSILRQPELHCFSTSKCNFFNVSMLGTAGN